MQEQTALVTAALNPPTPLGYSQYAPFFWSAIRGIFFFCLFGWAAFYPCKRLWFVCVLLLDTVRRRPIGWHSPEQCEALQMPLKAAALVSHISVSETRKIFFFLTLVTCWPLCERLIMCHSVLSCYCSEILCVQYTALSFLFFPGLTTWDRPSHSQLSSFGFISAVEYVQTRLKLLVEADTIAVLNNFWQRWLLDPIMKDLLHVLKYSPHNSVFDVLFLKSARVQIHFLIDWVLNKEVIRNTQKERPNWGNTFRSAHKTQ